MPKAKKKQRKPSEAEGDFLKEEVEDEDKEISTKDPGFEDEEGLYAEEVE